jgi:hypothetical protein
MCDFGIFDIENWMKGVDERGILLQVDKFC